MLWRALLKIGKVHQLILGEDVLLRDKIINDLKSRLFKNSDALKFDLQQLDAQGLDYEILKAACLTAAAVAKQRLLIVSRCEKLKDEHLDLIEHVVADTAAQTVIVLTAKTWDKRSAARKRLFEKLKVSGGIEQKSIFDLFQELPRDRISVLVKLQAWFEDDAVENILGALRWQWANKVKGTIPAARYKNGLMVIQEADERIKLSGMLSREQAVEVAFVKLSELWKHSKV